MSIGGIKTGSECKIEQGALQKEKGKKKGCKDENPYLMYANGLTGYCFILFQRLCECK